jgi:type IV pilus assembly protein PilA
MAASSIDPRSDRPRSSAEAEAGFTLVEIMVTVLVLGILISIALPTFLGARQRAHNRAAQSNLRNGLVAVKVFYSDRGTYVGFTAPVARGLEPELIWAAAGSPAVGQVRIGGSAPTATSIMLVTQSRSTRYFCIKDVAGPAATAGTFYASGAAYANVNTFARCSAARW